MQPDLKKWKDKMTSAPPAYGAKVSSYIDLFPSLRGQRILLCSSSPRRQTLLRQIGIEAEVVPSNFPETLSKTDLTPWEYATKTATGKVLAVYRATADDENEPRLLIAADTVILAGHSIVEKPSGPSAQLDMLKLLRREPHKVFTAVVVLRPDDDMPVAPGYILRSHIEETTVEFDSTISDDLLAAYVQTGEGSDKAGGYAIQGQGALLVKKIDGSYDSVVGLPLNATYQLIQEVLNWDPYQPEEEEEED